ncbi:MAG: CPBP family intramembrane glutamic endopeptidase [Terracidiphilus sp.]|jgi:hypothetical protein
MEDRGASGSGRECSVAARGKRRDLLELAVAYLLILLVVWTPRPWQRLLWCVAAASVVAILCISFDGLKTMGLRRANFFPSLWVAGVALAVAAVAVALAAKLHTLRVPRGPVLFIETYWAYALWTFAQQFLLQCFFLLRLRRLAPGAKSAAAMAAVLFAIAHLPNPILTSVTLIWGFAACLLFLRYRNLYPLAMAHAILGITIAITVPGPVDHNMRVGLGYLTYRHRIQSTAYPSPQP